MIEFATPSTEDLADRRRRLRQKRRVRNLQTIWRVVAVSGLAVGTLGLLANPFWLLGSRAQVTITGNSMLSDEAIHALLPLQYPQPLLEVKPNQVAQFLQTQMPITRATVTRHLFPPRLEIDVQERRPVAVTIPAQLFQSGADVTTAKPAQQPGLLDSEGYWMPQASVTQVDPKFELPQLAVHGFDEAYTSQWPGLYQALQSSSVLVSKVDWRQANNVILSTQLGDVHLGIYDPYRIQQQLETLAQLETLTANQPTPEIEYIDLVNPQKPAVKLASEPHSTELDDRP